MKFYPDINPLKINDSVRLGNKGQYEGEVGARARLIRVETGCRTLNLMPDASKLYFLSTDFSSLKITCLKELRIVF